MKVRAIVPQKRLTLAKGRLAGVLAPRPRAALGLALLRRVCATLRAVLDVEDVTVMASDPDVQVRAAGWGIRVVPDPAAGLNAALAQALVSLSRWSHGILIIAGDLPFLQPADVVALLRAVPLRGLGLAPSKDGLGTNALVLAPGVLIRPAFGRGSLAAHRGQAVALGLMAAEVGRPGLAFDLDTPADYAAYITAGGRA